MSLKTRLQKLEARLAAPTARENVLVLIEVIINDRAEVEQLRAAGLLDDKQHRPAPGPINRVEMGERITAAEALARERRD
jgi:hypothetical protein